MVSVSPYPDITIPNTDLWSFLFQRENRPFDDSKTVLTDALTGRSYSFGDAKKLGLSFGRNLQRKWNWQRGDVLTIISANSIDLPPIIWGTVAVGGVVSPLNPAFLANELVHYLKDSGSKAIVTQKAQYPVASAAAQKAGLGLDRIIVTDGQAGDVWQPNASLVSDSEFLTRPHTPPITKPAEEVAFLVYSSGTTGLPKGVMLTHSNVIANLIQSEAVDNGVLTYRDNVLAFLPFFHIYGLTYLVNFGIFLGMSTFIMSRFDLELFCSTIQTHKITYAYIVPPVILQLLQNPKAAKYDLGTIRMFMCSAAPLSPELIHAMRSKYSIGVRQGYGMSECSPCLHLQTWQESFDHPGVVGRLLPNVTAKYVPIEGEETTDSANREGELWVKGPNVFPGYLNNKKATDESFSPDGWYKTGDVGYENAEGHFIITDRVKELIKYNGFQVAPAELEGILLGLHPIADVAVVGVPSGQSGSELVRAYVKTKSKEQATEQTAQEIMQFVKENMVHYKQLRGGVHFVDAIPRNPSGKILRRELKKQSLSKL